MKLIRLVLIFCVLSVVVGLLARWNVIVLGNRNYWDFHGWGLLVGLSFFPRLALLVFVPSAWFGLVGWLGWLLTPHLMVAVLATLQYWNNNPYLVVAAWFIALGAESSEKIFVLNRRKKFTRSWSHLGSNSGPSSGSSGRSTASHEDERFRRAKPLN